MARFSAFPLFFFDSLKIAEMDVTLRLDRFAEVPTLDFGEVKLGTSKTLALKIQNLASSEQLVKATGTPPKKVN